MTERLPLSKLQDYVKLITEFGKVERVIYFPGTNRQENDQEHSYSLAMTAWYLIASNKLPLNVQKVLEYALVHDLVEVFAGDTYIYGDSEHLSSKEEREAEAAKRLIEAHPEFQELHATIAEYMGHEDAESRFVYALDKVLPVLLIHSDGGRTWKEKKITLDMLISHKTSKVAVSPEIQAYFDELVEILSGEEGMFA